MTPQFTPKASDHFNKNDDDDDDDQVNFALEQALQAQNGSREV